MVKEREDSMQLRIMVIAENACCIIATIGFFVYMTVYLCRETIVQWLVWTIGVALLLGMIFSTLKNAYKLEEVISRKTGEHVFSIGIILCFSAIVVRIVCEKTTGIFLVYTFAIATTSVSILTSFLVDMAVTEKSKGNIRSLKILFGLIGCVVGTLYTVLFLSTLLTVLGYGADEKSAVFSILAAIIGGGITLTGVAWTIRKGDADRKADLLRIEKERKEEERKMHVPYLKVVVGVQTKEMVNCYIEQPLNFDDENSMTQMEKNTFYRIMIDDFLIKNVSSHNVLLRGIILDGKYYQFDNQHLLESNNVCQVRTTRNWELTFAKPLERLLICVEDIIGNKYTIACKLNSVSNESHSIVTTDAGKEYYGWLYNYHIDNLSLPILAEE